MNFQSLIQTMINAGIEKNEAKYEIKLILEHFFNYTEIDRLKGICLNHNQNTELEEIISNRIKTRTPIQYMLGKAWFMGDYYKVTKDVLIPRDETELLVKRAIGLIKENNFEDVLDIGTGSGCIACSIAKYTAATVLGVDISTDALRVALDNVTKLGINNRAIFRKSDLFEKIRDGESFDMIISNPPYIPIGTELSLEVMHEPQIALFAEENGLHFYKKIINEAPEYLNPNGYVMFELGINESEEVKTLMEKDFKNIVIEKDLAQIDRIIYGNLK